jgi:uncharacterized protein YnzC (UPF0291/DUF896 family)
LTQNGKEVPPELSNQVFNILNRLVRKAESYGLTETSEKDESLGVYLYRNYLEIIEKEVRNNFVGKSLSENDFKNIINGFFIWR